MQSIWQRIGVVAFWLFSGCVCLSLYIGWRLSGRQLLVADHGAGYVLGVFGAAFMVILLIYPLRKRLRGFEFIGNVKSWFRIHMILGILGPLLVLYHCNFRLGSTNSNVALVSMLIVAGSGIIGRYLYRHIHYGLYGERATLLELKAALDQQKDEVSPHIALVPGLKERLFGFAESVIHPPEGFLQSAERFFVARVRLEAEWSRSGSATDDFLRRHAEAHGWSSSRRRKMRKQVRRKTRRFLNQAIRVAEFSLFERLFSLWHVLHVPLVFMLAFAAIIHVIATRVY